MQKTLKKLLLPLFAVLFSFALAFGLVACVNDNNDDDGKQPGGGNQQEEPTVAVTGVTISDDTLELMVGESENISASVAPRDASNKRLTWESDDEDVATVNGGRVTAVGRGTATITVTTVDGGFTDECVVTVSAIDVVGISLNPATLSLEEGAQSMVSLSVIPDNASDPSVSWNVSGDEGVIDFNEASGAITALKAGQATITATSNDNPERTASCTITVTARAATDYTGYTEIDSVEDWALIGQNPAGKYVLTADIDFGNRQVNTIGRPVGSAATTDFTGVLDGNGYAIMNAHFVSGGLSDAGDPNNSYSGMIAVNRGTVRNINVINCATSGEAWNALLVCWNHGLIENCYVQGSVANNNQWWDPWTLGGVMVDINQGQIRNCVSWGIREGITYGLVGSNVEGEGVYIENCYVIRTESISDYKICGDVNGNYVTQLELVNSAYVDDEDKLMASSYPTLNTYFWVVEDGKVPYLKTADGTERDWQGPVIGEVVIVPEIAINEPATTTFSLGNGATQLSYTLSPAEANDLDVEITWSSNNEEVATVENGVVSFKSAGEVVITVKVTYNDTTDEDTITLTINE